MPARKPTGAAVSEATTVITSQSQRRLVVPEPAEEDDDAGADRPEERRHPGGAHEAGLGQVLHARARRSRRGGRVRGVFRRRRSLLALHQILHERVELLVAERALERLRHHTRADTPARCSHSGRRSTRGRSPRAAGRRDRSRSRFGPTCASRAGGRERVAGAAAGGREDRLAGRLAAPPASPDRRGTSRTRRRSTTRTPERIVAWPSPQSSVQIDRRTRPSGSA